MLGFSSNLDGSGGASLSGGLSFDGSALVTSNVNEPALDNLAPGHASLSELSLSSFDALSPLAQGSALNALDSVTGSRAATDSLFIDAQKSNAPFIGYEIPLSDDDVTLNGDIVSPPNDIVVTANPVLSEAVSPESMSQTTFDHIFSPVDEAIRAERDAHFEATGETYSVLSAEIDLANRANVIGPRPESSPTSSTEKPGGFFGDFGLGLGAGFNLHVDREGVTGSVGAGLFGRLSGGYASDYQALLDARAQDKVFAEAEIAAPVVGSVGVGAEYSYGTDKAGAQVGVGPVALKDTVDINSGELSVPELSLKGGQITGKSDGTTSQLGFDAGIGWLHQGATREWVK